MATKLARRASEASRSYAPESRLPSVTRYPMEKILRLGSKRKPNCMSSARCRVASPTARGRRARAGPGGGRRGALEAVDGLVEVTDGLLDHGALPEKGLAEDRELGDHGLAAVGQIGGGGRRSAEGLECGQQIAMTARQVRLEERCPGQDGLEIALGAGDGRARGLGPAHGVTADWLHAA